MQKLKHLIKGNDLIVAPVVFNPIMARMAADAGFQAVYLSGGTLGWVKCVTEANLTLPEMAEVAVDMRAACKLPIVLDAGGGWGDPVHVHRTIALADHAHLLGIAREAEHHVGAGLGEGNAAADRLVEAAGAPCIGAGDDHEVGVAADRKSVV